MQNVTRILGAFVMWIPNSLWLQSGETVYRHSQSMNPSPYRTILSIKGEVKSDQSVEHQTNGEHHVAYHSVQAMDPKHGWPQVVTTWDCKASGGLKLLRGIFVVD